MYCSQCGKKMETRGSVCPACQAKNKKSKSGKKGFGFKLPQITKPTPSPKIFLYFGIAVASLALIGGGVFFFLNKRPAQDKLKTQEAQPTTQAEDERLSESFKAEFGKLINIEKEFLEKSQVQAFNWDQNAQVCYFSVSFQHLKDDDPYTLLYYCAPEKETMFAYRWFDPKKIRTEELKQKPYEVITPFPLKLSAAYATQLLFEDFKAKHPENERLMSFMLLLKGNQDYWYFSIKIKDDNEPSKAPQETTCKVYFDYQVFCEQNTTFTAQTDSDYAKLLENVETYNLEKALEKAKNWDEKAQLNHFYISVNDLTKTKIYAAYTFFSENKEKFLELTWSDLNDRAKEEEKAITYLKKIAMPEFPPNLTAAEALDLAIKDYQIRKLADQELDRFYLILDKDNDFWQVYLNAKDAQKRTAEYGYRVYFDKRVEPK